MKKIVFLATVIILLFTTACNKNLKYDEWKDTIMSFGDGTYQIIHQTVKDENVELLTNCKHNQCVLTRINDYIKEEDYVYFVGYYYSKKVYCKLNTKNNMLSYFAEENDEEFIMVYLNNMIDDKQIELYSSLSEFSENDKKIFDSIS